MPVGDVLKPLAVFVVVVAVIVGGSAATSMVGDEPAPSPEESMEPPPAHQPDNILASPTEDTGDIEIADSAEEKVILIDDTHGNSFSREDIQPIVEPLFEGGHEVRYLSSQRGPGSSFNETLQEADGFLIISPGREYADDEVDSVVAYARGGGRVVMLGNPITTQISLAGLFGISQQRITSEVNPLASEFDMGIGTESLYNMRENANNYQQVYAEPAGGGDVSEGVDRVVFERPTRVYVGEESTTVLSGLESTRLSSSRRADTYAMAAQNGNVTLVGDTSFLRPTRAYDADNEVLLGNLLDFLITGEKPGDVPSTDEENGAADPAPPAPSPEPEPAPSPTPTPTPTG